MCTRECSSLSNIQRIVSRLCMVFFIILFSGADVRAKEGKPEESAIFLPFHIELAAKYDYLRDGLTSVLASRVATRTGIRVVHDTTATGEIAAYFKAGQQEKISRILDKSRADYLVMGSLAGSESEFLLSVFVVSRKEGHAPRQFNRRLGAIDEALPVMDELAWDVSAEVFGVERPKLAVSAEDQGDGMSGFQTAHPDRAYKEGMFAGIVPGFESGNFSLLDVKRSPKISYGVNDMDAGDLDADGSVEVVMVAADRLYIYQFADGHFKKIKTIELASYLRAHAVSLADLNGNGLMEIYVSANNKGKPESTVIEWNGRQAKILQARVPYYLSVAAPDGQPSLLGQVGGAHGTSSVIGEGVYRLRWNANGILDQGEQVVLPDGLTVFDIAFADLDSSGEQELIAINRSNQLQIYDSAGGLLWTDPGQYGGSSNYLGTMATAARSDRRVYVPPRIVTTDVNGDGTIDIVVGKNRMKVIKYFKRYRYFEGSTIAALSWQQGALVPLWESKKLPEYTVNSQVVMPEMRKGQNNDGRFRLFFAQGQNNYSFGFWQTRSTSLFMYELGPKKQQDT